MMLSADANEGTALFRGLLSHQPFGTHAFPLFFEEGRKINIDFY